MSPKRSLAEAAETTFCSSVKKKKDENRDGDGFAAVDDWEFGSLTDEDLSKFDVDAAVASHHRSSATTTESSSSSSSSSSEFGSLTDEDLSTFNLDAVVETHQRRSATAKEASVTTTESSSSSSPSSSGSKSSSSSRSKSTVGTKLSTSSPSLAGSKSSSFSSWNESSSSSSSSTATTKSPQQQQQQHKRRRVYSRKEPAEYPYGSDEDDDDEEEDDDYVDTGDFSARGTKSSSSSKPSPQPSSSAAAGSKSSSSSSSASAGTFASSISRDPVFECHPSVSSIIGTVSEQLYNKAASLGWFMDPTSPYYDCVRPLELTGAVNCRTSRQIYALVLITEDGVIIILKIGRTTNINLTKAIRYSNLPPGQKIIILSPCMKYDLEMESHTTDAVRQVCEKILEADCPQPIRIVYDMVLNDGYHLGLKPAVAHELLECGAQEHHDVRRPAELGMNDDDLEKACYDLAENNHSEMVQSVVDFLASRGLTLDDIKGCVLTLSNQAWPYSFKKEEIIGVTPLIMEKILKLSFWMDQFPKPAKSLASIESDSNSNSDSVDGSKRSVPYNHDYDKAEKQQAIRRHGIVLDSIGGSLSELIQKLKASGEIDGIFEINTPPASTNDASKTDTPLLTILMVNTNQVLNHDHTVDFASRGFTKIHESHDFEEGTLQLWMRHDCLIIYHSPLYRATCSAMKKRGCDHETKESVRRSISVMAESIRRLIFTLRGIPYDGPNFIEAYLVRLLVSKGLHVGEMIGSAAWKHYFMKYYDGETESSKKVNCFQQNNLHKTSAVVDFSYPSFRRGRRAVNHGHYVEVDDDKRVNDTTIFLRASMLLTQVDATPGSSEERSAFYSIQNFLTKDVVDPTSRIVGFVDKLEDGDLADRFTVFTKEGKSHGNPTASGATNATKDINNLIAEGVYALVPKGSTEKVRCWVHATTYPKGTITMYRSNLEKQCPREVLAVGEKFGTTYRKFEIAYETLKTKCRKTVREEGKKTSHKTTSRPPVGMSITTELIDGKKYVHDGWMLMTVFWDT